ncbi:DUF1212-domain-containing protein [Acaromyces ingoldii]|uniref:DUF1212-domain-containing protein n=1 Tax=Acaromyces ingoldii TaxID=215250 RepID=A0A316YTR3_9BASI|nr:DUF1212-domain-containing protein [Acaromyces ingoldii]PWN92436.1 DUF1212-domain-containing protein [Acaromyces ingoldii]
MAADRQQHPLNLEGTEQSSFQNTAEHATTTLARETGGEGSPAIEVGSRQPTGTSTPGGLNGETVDGNTGTGGRGSGSAPSSATARRGRVHWDSGAGTHPGLASKRFQGQHGGPTVTVRQPAAAATQAGGGVVPTSSTSVQRAHHPGPLMLHTRLSPMNEQPSEGIHQGLEEGKAQENRQLVPTLSLTGAKSLDERGLDNRAFLELQRELQRHEAHEGTDAVVAENGDWIEMQGGGQQQQQQQSQQQQQQQQQQRRRKSKAETPDWASSGTSTPGGGDWTSESGSYDPANDSDLDHIDFMPGETDGLPARRKKKKGAAEEEDAQPKGWARIRGLMFGKGDEDEAGKAEAQTASSPTSRPYEEGGPTNTKSVPVTTSTGTRPGGPRSRPTKFEREAAKLVRAHKLMTGQGAGSMSEDDGMPGVSSMPTNKRDHLDSGASTPDNLDTAANLSARPIAAGGVLGNLLKLYEQQQKEQQAARKASGMSSEATSPLSTPGPAGGSATGAGGAAAGIGGHGVGDGNLSDLVAAELRREDAAAKARGARPISSTSSGVDSPSRRRMSWAPSGGNSPGWTKDITSGGLAIAGAGKKVLSIAAKEAGIDEAIDERPKASRSSAGTIGGLIATTGNLIGAVSPYHAQLGPNPKRPGYTLDRYLLPEMNAKTLKRTAEIVADAAPRPHWRSQPGTPGAGHHSPGMSSLDHKEPDSAETQAMTPPSGGAHSPRKSFTRPSSIINVRPNSTKTALHTRKNSAGTAPHSAGAGAHLHLPHMPNFARTWTGHSNVNTPDVLGDAHGSDYFGKEELDEKAAKAEWQRKLKRRAKDKRKKEEIFITMHVAAILQRQEFLMKLARALMMFGAPTHRIETQIQQTARVLEINCRCIYLPNLMLLAFGDDTTHTSETKFIKQGGGLDLTKLTDMHSIYWNVIHDKIGVAEASSQLDELMRRKPIISRIPMVIIGGFCSSFICVGPMGFSGSFIDALAAFPLGCFLVFCQSVITTELFSNVFEILFAAINSFVASALASTGYFCYAGVVSGSIVLILPGFIVLSGSLELQSKNLIAGSVRLVYAIIYSLFLGFGISIGYSFWLLFSGSDSDSQTLRQCSVVHNDKWWMSDVPLIWALLTVPGYSIALSIRNQAKVTRKEFPVMVAIAIAGWATNHFAAQSKSLSQRSDVTSALGAMAVGLLSNVFGRIYDGKSYTVACVGVLYQLPSGLSGGGGLLSFANDQNNSAGNISSGFSVAQSLVEVALGLTVGLYAATVIAYIVGGRKIRGGGLFSF